MCDMGWDGMGCMGPPRSRYQVCSALPPRQPAEHGRPPAVPRLSRRAARIMLATAVAGPEEGTYQQDKRGTVLHRLRLASWR